MPVNVAKVKVQAFNRWFSFLSWTTFQKLRWLSR